MEALTHSPRSFYWASICCHLSISFCFFSSSTFHLQLVPDVIEVPLCCAFASYLPSPRAGSCLSFISGAGVFMQSPRGWFCIVPTFLSSAFCFQSIFPLLPFLSALALQALLRHSTEEESSGKAGFSLLLVWLIPQNYFLLSCSPPVCGLQA